MVIRSSTLLTALDFIPPIYQKKLTDNQLETVGDLLYFFPSRYEDFSLFKKIKEIEENETVTVEGIIKKITTRKTFRKKILITEAILTDETGQVTALWFNFSLPLKFLQIGKSLRISGKVSRNAKNQLFFQHPNFEIISQWEKTTGDQDRSVSTGRLVPVYSENNKLPTFFLRRIIKKILADFKAEEIIPQAILDSQKIIDLQSALQWIHFPPDLQKLEAAKKRLGFEKMFLIQLNALQVKKKWEQRTAIAFPFQKERFQSFVRKLPFTLTAAQKKTAWQIVRDLEKNHPMNRLLEGDVGSGKTVVAALAAFSVIDQHHQVALLAPTEILANQHFENLKKLLLPWNFSLGLLTSARKIIQKNTTEIISSPQQVMKNLRQGSVDLIVGTHALLQKKVNFKNLALVIIDEQHRFGVAQRAFLQQKTATLKDGLIQTIPHLLTMTATPIPRTLALAIFGNLDLSIIDQYPAGRQKIITRTINKSGRSAVYQFIRQEILKKHQVFIICPLIEESEKVGEVKAATAEFERLKREIFPSEKMGLLHGKMKPAEKEAIMQAFRDKHFAILVATSVIEVGIDIPDATVILIEGAERFGLSQLHQFRGRVGRGQWQSYCFLFSSDEKIPPRLKIMEKHQDGFEIAEKDLALRGPGQFLGQAQSGNPDIAMASLKDLKILQNARLEAQRILAFDPQLEKFPQLKREVAHLKKNMHWE